MGQDVFICLTWRVTPQVSEGRASRTTVRASVNSPWWEAIIGKLLREIIMTNNTIVSYSILLPTQYRTEVAIPLIIEYAVHTRYRAAGSNLRMVRPSSMSVVKCAAKFWT